MTGSKARKGLWDSGSSDRVSTEMFYRGMTCTILESDTEPGTLLLMSIDHAKHLVVEPQKRMLCV